MTQPTHGLDDSVIIMSQGNRHSTGRELFKRRETSLSLQRSNLHLNSSHFLHQEHQTSTYIYITSAPMISSNFRNNPGLGFGFFFVRRWCRKHWSIVWWLAGHWSSQSTQNLLAISLASRPNAFRSSRPQTTSSPTTMMATPSITMSKMDTVSFFLLQTTKFTVRYLSLILVFLQHIALLQLNQLVDKSPFLSSRESGKILRENTMEEELQLLLPTALTQNLSKYVFFDESH